MYNDLDNREQGIYRNLIDECWVSGSISSNIESLARFVHEATDYFAIVWTKIRHKFRPIDNGNRFISARLEEDRRRLMLNGKLNEKRAKKAANVRWAKERAEKELHAHSINVASPKHAFEHCQTQTQTKEEVLFPLKDSPNIINDSSIDIGKGSGETARRTRAPAELQITDSMLSWAAEHQIAVNLDTETEHMLDHYRGKGETRLDWIATWRTWMRNSKKFNRGNGNGQHSTKQSRTAEATRRVLLALDQQNRERSELRIDRGDSSGISGISTSPLKR